MKRGGIVIDIEVEDDGVVRYRITPFAHAPVGRVASRRPEDAPSKEIASHVEAFVRQWLACE